MSDRLCLVIDANDGPCVRPLFKSVAACGWRVVLVRVITPAHLLRRFKVPFRLMKMNTSLWQVTVVVPGYRKFRRVSEALLSLVRRSIQRRMGKPDVVFYTMPRYCNLMQGESSPSVYFAYDPYKLYYDWDYDQTEEQEDLILQKADMTFAVSRRICSDWQEKVKKPPIHLPNAVDGEFLKACQSQSSSQPEDLARLDGPIIGCIGNINRSYDWVLIGKMSDALPNANFVFVGQITEATHEIEEIRKKKNVIFTGWRRPEDLAGYLAGFDVCLNPLTVNDMNNRRCPLRFYTYLCASTPVVSTGIDEAHDLSDYILVGESHDECVDLVTRAAEGGIDLDLEKRRKFMLAQTWKHRARTLMDHVDKVVFDA